MLVLMLITSGGIFGFLSDAYNKSSGTVKVIDKELVLIQKQKDSKELQIQQYQSRINELTNIRNQEERRTDTLYSKRYTKSAKAVMSDIKSTTDGIEQYTVKIESLQKDITALDTSLISKESQVLKSDVGPLRYIANVFNTNMDNVVKWFILLLIFVFDPIAIALIVSFNITLFKDGRKSFNLLNLTIKKKLTQVEADEIIKEVTEPIQKQKIEQKVEEPIQKSDEHHIIPNIS